MSISQRAPRSLAITACLLIACSATQTRALRGNYYGHYKNYNHAPSNWWVWWGAAPAPAPVPAPAYAADEKNIVELAVATPALSTLVTAVKAADLVDVLSGEGPFTVFAPTNDAFDKVPAKVLTALLEPANQDKLQQLLKYHVVSGAVTSGDLKNGEEVATLEGSDVAVKIETGDDGKTTVMINDATVVSPDVMASNGVVHVIDAVLIPSALDELVAALSS
jgi:uncharacterized surface protein with fasciclin (FAS1) repeats